MSIRQTDVVIVGGGLAGSLAAAMLGRAAIDTVLIDPHAVYPVDFRCEKLDGPQMRTLELTGLADAVLRASTPDRESWVARFGHVIEKRPGDQEGILYDTLVNTLRSEIPAGTAFVVAKAADVSTGPQQQTVTLSTGEQVLARLVVLANGLNTGMRHKLGMGREVISPGHSISVGFDAVPAPGTTFPFPALTYYTERPADRAAYITLFPIGATMRANFFSYRDLHDPWLKRLRDAPRETLYEMWPRLRDQMGEFTVPDFVKIRPVDLYVTTNYLRDGIVLVGDAFATSCPAAGTGARRALVDIERLCNVHIPGWLATPGMQASKIEAFYGDPVKQACDAYSLEKAFSVRSFSIDQSAPWVARRWAKFIMQGGRGMLRGAVPASSDEHTRRDTGHQAAA